MYGTQAKYMLLMWLFRFENDVKMYGTQAEQDDKEAHTSLRMM